MKIKIIYIHKLCEHVRVVHGVVRKCVCGSSPSIYYLYMGSSLYNIGYVVKRVKGGKMTIL